MTHASRLDKLVIYFLEEQSADFPSSKAKKAGDKEVDENPPLGNICCPPTLAYKTFSTLSEEEIALPSFFSHHQLLYRL